MNIVKLHANCVPVSGASRSLIYDLQKSVVHAFDKKNEQLLLKLFRVGIPLNELNFVDNEIIKYLLDKELAHSLPRKFANKFPALSFKFKYPSTISNAIIEIGADINALKKLFRQFEQLLTTSVQIKILDLLPKKELDILNVLLTNSIFSRVELYVPYSFKLMGAYFFLIKNNAKIASIFIYNSPQYKNHETDRVFEIKENIHQNISHIVSFHNLVCNMTFFSESINYNTYYNRKIAVDQKGYIKNSPELKWDYGHISKTKLIDVICKKDFKKLWNVSKDKIDVCRDCEFRHMCMDARVPERRRDGSYYMESECNYNPYIGKWRGEPEYLTLAECGIYSNRNGFVYNGSISRRISNLNNVGKN